jgi:arylsulfatase
MPLGASREFRGKSPLGLYGDAIMELDWSTGKIFELLSNLGLDNNTLVMFSSDNGPWFQGSPGGLRGRKGETLEGGLRVPMLARFPGVIPAGRKVKAFASTLDILPTLAGFAGADLPPSPLDGVDIRPLLTGDAEEVSRPLYLYFQEYDIQCARLGKWKLHVARSNGPAFAPPPAEGRLNLRLVFPELYNLELDPAESYNVAADNPTVVADIQAKLAAMLPTLPPLVQLAWKNTQNRPVNPTKDGEWPTPAN